MNIVSLSLIGILLIIVSMGVIGFADYSSSFKVFENNLTQKQVSVHHKIVWDRKKLYMQGLALGSVLGYILYKLNLFENAMIGSFFVAFTVISTQYIYYIVSNKEYMLTHLTSKNQTTAWLKLSTFIQRKCHVAIVIAFLGYFLLAYLV